MTGLQVGQLATEESSVLRLLATFDSADRLLRTALSEIADAPSTYQDRRPELDDLHQARARSAEAVASALLAASRRDRAAIIAKDCAPSEVADDSTQGSHDRVDADVTTGRNGPVVSVVLSAEQITSQLRRLAPEPCNPAPQTRDADSMRTLLDHTGRPSDNPGEDGDRLVRATARDNWTRWSRLSPDARRIWLSYLVAWVRAGRNETPANAELRAAFSNLRAYSAECRPGPVNGFKLTDVPDGRPTWRHAAHAIANGIRPLELEQSPTGEDHAAERDELTLAPNAAETRYSTDLPDDWPFWSEVSGRQAAIFGGAPREARRLALERAFRLTSLEWVGSGKPRLAESLRERVRAGSLPLVLITKFAGHRDSEGLVEAAKAAGSIAVVLRAGYGIQSIREGLEAALARYHQPLERAPERWR